VSELAEAKERLLRALAEQENVRRRAQRQVEEGTKHAVADFARDLLSTVDNLSRAAASMPDVKPADGALLQVLTGISATERGLIETLEKHGIRRIDPLGAPFDPHLHEAMFEVANPMQAPGTVVEVLQPGYIQHDRLLRPAMVGVVARPREPA
jgi:molecular chaperone GrpE